MHCKSFLANPNFICFSNDLMKFHRRNTYGTWCFRRNNAVFNCINCFCVREKYVETKKRKAFDCSWVGVCSEGYKFAVAKPVPFDHNSWQTLWWQVKIQAGRWPPRRKITNLFTTLRWPRDCKEIFWSSGQAASPCPVPVYHTRWRLHQ